MYLEDRRSELPGLKELLSKGEFDRIRVLAHDVRGTGKAYGFAGLTEIACGIETGAKALDRAGVEFHLKELQDYLNRVRL